MMGILINTYDTMAKILLVEDEINIASFIERGLREFGHEVYVAYDGAAGWELTQKNDFQLLILDIIMPKMNGLQLCKQYRQRFGYHAPVIMLTALGTTEDIVSGLDAGADDYITKPFNPLELLARVKSMMRRYTSLGSIAEKNNVIRIGDVELDKDAKEVRVNGKLVKMTATEYGILQLLMENAGKVFSIDEIYERVWNESSFSPENTVSVHIRRIREKIEINPKEPRYLKVVWGIGYKIEKI